MTDDLVAIRERDQQWLRLVWKGAGADKILEDAYNAAGNDRRALLAEVDRLRHDIDRSMANHVADINGDCAEKQEPLVRSDSFDARASLIEFLARQDGAGSERDYEEARQIVQLVDDLIVARVRDVLRATP